MNCKILKLCALICAAFFTVLGVSAQEYEMPVKIKGKMLLSANYGEVRGTGIHTGLDIKTNGVEGKPVVAAAGGYISRIGIKPYGYGKVLYVTHPNGTTTVYGHLREFAPEIEAFVRAERYRRRQSSVDLYLKPDVFPVRKGRTIGYSGNTGRSSGPHLHFEVRETKSQRTLNPLSRQMAKPYDNLPPEIHALYYFTVDTVAGVPSHNLIAEATPVRSRKGTYKLSAPLEIAGEGYFVVEVVDRMNDSYNTMGVAGVRQKINGKVNFEYVMDSFTFTQAAYASALTKYDIDRGCRFTALRLSCYDGLQLPFYRNVSNRGVVDAAKARNVEIRVADDHGNVSTLKFDVTNNPDKQKKSVEIRTGAHLVRNNSEFSCNDNGLFVMIPSGALYEPVFYCQSKLDAASVKVVASSGMVPLTDFYEVHTDSVPLGAPINISIKADLPDSLADKVLLARINGGGWPVCTAAKYADGVVSGKVKSFGIYCVTADTTAPVITPLFDESSDFTATENMMFEIRDDLSGVASYEAFVDGKWVILEHDTMKSRLIYSFDDDLIGCGMEHNMTIVVIDGVGNRSEYNLNFYR